MKRYLRDYWSLRRLNLGAAIASLLFVSISAACTESDVVADPPISAPQHTTTTTTTAYAIAASEVVDLMEEAGVDICGPINGARDTGMTDSEMFRYFAEGYGEGTPSARSVWNEMRSRC